MCLEEAILATCTLAAVSPSLSEPLLRLEAAATVAQQLQAGQSKIEGLALIYCLHASVLPSAMLTMLHLAMQHAQTSASFCNQIPLNHQTKGVCDYAQ